LTFEPALESLEFTTEGGSQTFLLYSNVPEWSIRCRYGDEWIDVWPAEGDFDGRFSVTVDENDRAELRYDHLEIYAGGELMRTLEVRSRRPRLRLRRILPKNRWRRLLLRSTCW